MRPPPPDEPCFTPPNRVTRALARALVAGPWELDAIIARAAAVVGRRARWIRPLARGLLARFVPDRPRPSTRQVADFLAEDAGLRRAYSRAPFDPKVTSGNPVMWPVPGAPAGWAVPALTNESELANWLEISPARLDGLADLQGRNRRTPPGRLRHYDYVWRPKSNGSARLLEAPRRRLKTIQRRILDEIVGRIPAHPAAHGFRPGRSVRTFAAPHVGREVVLRMDLLDFFPSITAAWVAAVFRAAGYPEPVARRLAGLCANRVPSDVWTQPGAPGAGPDTWRARRRHLGPHLPQGSPASPALANLCAYRLDSRLTALAASAGAVYTRYADDLAFSGDARLARSIQRFIVAVAATAIEEGLAVNPRKTRVMRRSVRQRLAGVVVNDRLNVGRDEYDRLRAILHNCARHGPASQDREGHADFRAHLNGRVAHLASLHPEHGRKLRAMLEAIAW